MSGPVVNIQTISRNRRPEVNQFIREVRAQIDAKLLHAAEAGYSQISHDLPTNFPALAHMSKADAQLYVYTEIIRVYRDMCGFEDLKIFGIKTGAPYIIISWKSGLGDNERRDRLDLLRSVCVDAQPN